MAEKDKEFVTMMDGSGRPVKIPRKEWVEKILPDNLRRANDNAEALHGMVVSALRDGLAGTPAVAEAVARLSEIDTDRERTAVVNGILLMQTGRSAEAEKVFDEYLSKHVPSPAILTNLAKLYFERGEEERAEQTLRQALAIDPNLDNGMAWYASIQRKRGGEEGFLAALRELANQPNSWRPQLWLARDLLKKKQVDEAMEYYRQVVSHGHLTPDGFVHITGDLGAAGEMARMLELIFPVYHPDKHGAVAGLNLINAMAQLGHMDEARAMLQRLQSQKNPALAPLIADTARRLAGASAAAKVPVAAQSPAADGRVQVAAVPLFNPIWTPPLNKPNWLMPSRQDGIKIAFFSLADSTRPADQPAPRRSRPAAG